MLNAQLKFPSDMGYNGVLRLYNQFPRFYPGGIEEMTEQLRLIKQMGFNAVWINPIQEVGTKQVPRFFGPVKRKKELRVSGSLYAMANSNEFNPDFQVTGDALIKYTEEARHRDLIPIFDLVVNQVADDSESPLCQSFSTYLKELSTEKKRKSKYSPAEWQDIRKFDYTNEDAENDIIARLWEPFLTKYIQDYGFMGVRVDAVKQIGARLQKKLYTLIHQLCEQRHRKKAVILGELLDNDPIKYVSKLQGTGLTHVLNNLFDTKFSADARCSNDEGKDNWKGDDSFAAVVPGTLRQIVYHETTENLAGIGGTIGYVGNHDRSSLACCEGVYSDNHQNMLTNMKEFIWGVALSSDSGWYLLCGDEYGAQLKPSNNYVVFKPTKDILKYVPKLPMSPADSDQKCYQNHWGSSPELDLTIWISAINWVLARVPGTKLYSYVEHFVIDNGLSVVARHTKASDHDQNESIDLVIGHFENDAMYQEFAVQQTLRSILESNQLCPELIEKMQSQKLNLIFFIDGPRVYKLDKNFKLIESKDLQEPDQLVPESNSRLAI